MNSRMGSVSRSVSRSRYSAPTLPLRSLINPSSDSVMPKMTFAMVPLLLAVWCHVNRSHSLVAFRHSNDERNPADVTRRSTSHDQPRQLRRLPKPHHRLLGHHRARRCGISGLLKYSPKLYSEVI